MPRIPQGKHVLYVYIEESLYNQLKELALESQDKVHGAISRLVENALREYLGKVVNPAPTPPGGSQTPGHTHAHTHTQVYGYTESVYQLTQPLPTKDKVEEKFREVMTAYIQSRGINYYPYEMPEREFTKAIESVIGSDPRTVDKWLEKFRSHRLIDIETRGVNRFIKILYPKTEETHETQESQGSQES
jgi:hypothetical protein